MYSESVTIDFDLWNLYWNELKSIQTNYKRRLQQLLPKKKIYSSIVSSFFSEKGKIRRRQELPELDEIYFSVRGKGHSIRICINRAKIEKAQVELLSKESREHDPSFSFMTKGKFHNIKAVFSEEMTKAVTDWLEKKRNDFVKKNFS